MLIKIKQKPIVIDCLTSDPVIFELAKISPASKFKPKWLKSLDRKSINVRSCPSFINLYMTGFVIPCPYEFEFTVSKINKEQELELYETEKMFFPNSDPMKFSVRCATERFGWPIPGDSHPPDQVFGWRSSTHRNFKMESGWEIMCSEYVKFLYVPMTWDDYTDDDYLTTSGLIDFKYNHTTNIHVWVDVTKENNFKIPIGRPLQHVIPLSERPLKINTELVSESEKERRVKKYFQGNMFNRGYQKMVAKLEGRL